MTTAATPRARAAAAPEAETRQQPADVLVVFGITGDLAKVMTFRSLYRLERRGLLDCPIVGVAVDDWTADDLRDRARTSIEGTGETLDQEVFNRLAARFSYVAGDFSDSATFERVAAEIKDASTPVFYLEIPPFLFGTVVKGLAEAGLTNRARVVVEKPFGHDLESARALAEEIHALHRRVSALPDRPLPRKDGPGRDSLSQVCERNVRAGLESQLRLLGPDHDGGELRGRGSRSLLRPGGRASGCGRQPPDAGGSRHRNGGADRGRRCDLKDSIVSRLSRHPRCRPGALRARAVRRATARSTGSPPTPPRRPTRPCASRSTTGAGRASPSSSAPGRTCR